MVSGGDNQEHCELQNHDMLKPWSAGPNTSSEPPARIYMVVEGSKASEVDLEELYPGQLDKQSGCSLKDAHVYMANPPYGGQSERRRVPGDTEGPHIPGLRRSLPGQVHELTNGIAQAVPSEGQSRPAGLIASSIGCLARGPAKLKGLECF